MSHVMNTYARQPVAFVRGEGVWLWDEAGKKYLDALAGIAVNTLAPGAIETDFGGGAVRDNAELNRMVASQTALGRVGKPDDIGDVIVTLLSSGAHWINGQRVEASGGMFL